MRRMPPILLALLLLCACTGQSPSTPPEDPELDRLLDAQLGVLADRITAEERQAARALLAQAEPLRQSRIQRGQYQKGEREERLLKRLNKLYEAYTVAYLNPEEEGFGYEYPPERTLAVYDLEPDGALTRQKAGAIPEGWTEADLTALWSSILDWMPEESFAHFDQVSFFTDGEYETVAYVQALDGKGSRWEFAVDPADAQDGRYFQETVLHEYFHSASLCPGQVTYTARQTVDTYNEPGMVTQAGSYLDEFYQAFWTDYLDDCLLCEDTYNFYLRHEDDFITEYASTDPSEDLCECFTFYVLDDPPEGEAVWEQKLRFFDRYPELSAFRQRVRRNLDLPADE